MDCPLDKRLQGFQLIAQEKLQAIICSIPGKKDLILEQTLIKPLEHICSASWLKLKGIQRIFKFDGQHHPIPHTEHIQVILLRTRLPTFQRVLQHIVEREEQQQQDASVDAALKHYHIVCVPSCFAYAHTLLEEEGLCGVVQLHRFNWDFIHLDQGVLSMEVPHVFPSLFMQRDTSFLPTIAQSLRVLLTLCGRPDVVLTFGEHSAAIVKMLSSMGVWQKRETTTPDSGPIKEFSAIIIMDRDRDYASSLLTPAIYSGLLLEVLHSRAGEVAIEAATNKILQQKLAIFRLPQRGAVNPPKPDEASSTPRSAAARHAIIRLNSQHDEIYGENRYKHFSQAIGLVRAQAKAIGLEVHKLGDMKLDEMHDYVARKLPKISELKAKVMRHLNASELVIAMLADNFRKVQALEEDILNNVSRKRILAEIDELLATDGQRYNTLRLICLLHLCAGLGGDELTLFIRNYCNLFGAQQLHVFQSLAGAGLLPAVPEDEKLLNRSTSKLLSQLPLPKFQQTEFQANANRLRLLTSATATGGEATSPSAGTGGAGGGTSGTASGADVACPSYVFNRSYIPVVAQLCSFLLKTTGADDFATKLGMVERIQLHAFKNNNNSSGGMPPHTVKSFAGAVRQGDCKDVFPLARKNIFVFVVGGVTYAEIAACDLIGRLGGAQIVVGSDAIVSGGDLIATAF